MIAKNSLNNQKRETEKNTTKYSIIASILFAIILSVSVLAAPSDIDITGEYKTSGTTRIDNSGVGTFASGTTINSQTLCLSDGSNCPAGATGSGWVNETGLVRLSNNGTNVSIGNSSNASSDVALMYIDVTNGRVGIGTERPSARFQIINKGESAGNSGTFIVNTTGNGGEAKFSIENNGVLLTLAPNGANWVNGFLDADQATSFNVGTSNGYPMDFYTNNAARMRITTGGNISMDTRVFFLDSTSDLVGIGTTGPSQKLTVNGSLNISGSSGSLYIPNGFISIAGTTRIANDGTGTFASGTTIAGNNICLESGSGCPVAAISPTSGWRNDSGAGNISMANTNANVSINTLFIDNTNGRIGVGTTSPQDKLHVTGGAIIAGTTGSEGGEIRIFNSSGQDEWYVDDTTGFLRIRHRDYATMMVFNRGNGYVGIGTDTPLSSLHSVGNVTATAFNATGVGSNDVTGYCLAYGPAGCALRQNTTCTWIISPNGATKSMACN